MSASKPGVSRGTVAVPGDAPTGAIEGVVISAVIHEGLTVTFNGRPARLAVVTEDGCVIASGPDVAREAEAVAHNSLRAMWKAQGHLRVYCPPIAVDAPQPSDRKCRAPRKGGAA
jgi:hypothetical protein